MLIRRILCAFAFGLVASFASAQQVPSREASGPDPSTLTEAQIRSAETPGPLSRLAALYKEKGDYERLSWALKRLTEMLPNNGQLKLALATTYALRDEKSNAYNLLLAMQKQGYGFDLAKDPNFDKISKTKIWPYILQGLSENLKPFGEGKVAFALPAGDHLYESLAFDPKRGQLLVGSVRDGTIQLVSKNGALTDFIKPDAGNGLWSVYALAVDANDDALYVASTASVYFKDFKKEDFGKAAVFKFRLSSGKLLEKYPVTSADAQPNTLSSIAVGKGGLVFAADGLRNVIYRLDGATLKPMVANPRLTSIRGLAVSGDGKTLYFADYMQGILGIDLAGGSGFDLRYDPAKLVLGGIDGLYWYDGTLVAIDNGMSPHRVMRLRLSPDGRSIVSTMALDAAKPELTLPTYGAIQGDALYFVANSQKNAYDAYGSPKADAKMEPVKVFRSDLRFAWDDGASGNSGKPAVISHSTAGAGKFSNVEGGSQSVTGN
jgi:sugar lactone lactonase YvrE